MIKTRWTCHDLNPMGAELLSAHRPTPHLERYARLVHQCYKTHFTTPLQNAKPVIYYDRCSSRKPMAKGSGVFRRITPSFRWMGANGYLPLIAIGENRSGRKGQKADKRRGLLLAVDVAKATGHPILVSSFDRMTRSADTMAWLLEEGVRVISTKEPGELGSGTLVASVKAARKGKELAAAGVRGHKALTASGKTSAGAANLDKHRHLGHETLTDQQRQDALACRPDIERAIRDLLANNPKPKKVSFHRIADWLNERGLKTPGRAKFSSTQVSRYLRHLPDEEALRHCEPPASGVVSIKPAPVSTDASSFKPRADKKPPAASHLPGPMESETAPASPGADDAEALGASAHSLEDAVAAPLLSVPVTPVSGTAPKHACPALASAGKPRSRLEMDEPLLLDDGDYWNLPPEALKEMTSDSASTETDEVDSSASIAAPSPFPCADVGAEAALPASALPVSQEMPRESNLARDVFERHRRSGLELREYPSGSWSPGPDSYRRVPVPAISEKPLRSPLTDTESI